MEADKGFKQDITVKEINFFKLLEETMEIEDEAKREQKIINDFIKDIDNRKYNL